MAAEDAFSYLIPAGHSEKHRRAPNWTDGEMKALLYVWEEHHNDLKTSKRNAKVYEKMSQRFYQLTGEQRFKEEIKMKITNMSFQYRRLRASVGDAGGSPDWPYYKPIEKILSKPVENGRGNSVEFKVLTSGPSTSALPTDNLAAHSEEGMVGFLPEYTGSSDELDIKQEVDSLISDTENSQASSSHPTTARKRDTNMNLSLKRKKLRIMQSMLQQQKKSSRAIEETCREVRRVMQQQNLLQVQCLQLQERMMNLLERMIQPPANMAAVLAQGGHSDPGKP
ncbi:myb/SANT-like DNA-binding domain-containing protein 1 [Gouania willdenowi]|uniref:Myb/SANT-like DNA-binding domain-containing protein 1 n=1 Tax=Gouania willdenowi TaxID=441366 RepID=A0A8C5GPR4_GOUWI|nr:myb/SANT-like DNA-binding domain-containing protein 1 [Gouania willdenowi]